MRPRGCPPVRFREEAAPGAKHAFAFFQSLLGVRDEAERQRHEESVERIGGKREISSSSLKNLDAAFGSYPEHLRRGVDAFADCQGHG